MDIPYGDATMWGPQPEKARKRLKPGDRMADGRVFMGDNPAAVLETALERVLLEMKPLEAKRDELLVRLAEVAPEKYGAKEKQADPAPADDDRREARSGQEPSPRKSKRGAA